ncbi:MAG: EamA/RhaT family transporter [Thermoprotei archaeon]|nr:MAG: EamA/RhaT family transporter [Thermoprotei archaeon]
MAKGRIQGLLALLITSILWGSSFPAIKLIVMDVSEYTYTWVRNLIALVSLAPYVFYTYSRGEISKYIIKGGLLAGVAYSLGLWLQSWGMKFTTASKSAFITGLYVVFVHVYTALIMRRYSVRLALALSLSIIGLYILTVPRASFNVGDLLVLLGALAWAVQIIIVDKFCHSNPLIFTFFETIPALTFAISALIRGIEIIPCRTFLLIVYLGLMCSNVAYALQVYGQRFLSPAIAAIIFLFEPVSAAIFAYVILKEVLDTMQIIGATMIILAMLISSIGEESYKITNRGSFKY